MTRITDHSARANDRYSYIVTDGHGGNSVGLDLTSGTNVMNAATQAAKQAGYSSFKLWRKLHIQPRG